MLQTPSLVSKLPRNPFKVSYSKRGLSQDLRRLHKAWRVFQSSRDRNAVYPFLSAAFELVQWWLVENKAVERAEQALELKEIAVPEMIEPFSAMITAAAHPTEVDSRLINKWSRVLRLAAAYKSPKERLRRFIRAKGGLNACATEYSHRLGRRKK
jgi:hypothetical protein